MWTPKRAAFVVLCKPKIFMINMRPQLRLNVVQALLEASIAHRIAIHSQLDRNRKLKSTFFALFAKWFTEFFRYG
jgi:hypothetical protein